MILVSKVDDSSDLSDGNQTRLFCNSRAWVMGDIVPASVMICGAVVRCLRVSGEREAIVLAACVRGARSGSASYDREEEHPESGI